MLDLLENRETSSRYVSGSYGLIVIQTVQIWNYNIRKLFV